MLKTYFFSLIKSGTVLIFLIFITGDIFTQDTIVLQPDAEDGIDAKVWSIEPNTNNGDHIMLKANAWSWGSGNDGIERSFFKFDLSELPEDITLLEAKLSLFYHYYDVGVEQTHSGENQSFLRRVLEPWDEYIVNWSNQPQITEVNQVILPESTDPRQDYTDIDISSLINDILLSGNNYGFRFSLATEENYRRMCFASSDHVDPNKRPKLEIIYENNCDSTVANFQYIVESDVVNFENLSLFADTYYWDFGDGNTSSNENPQYIYTENGEYYVCLTTENDCNTDMFCDSVSYSNLGMRSEYFDATINIYPNPVINDVFIEFQEILPDQLIVYNIYGKKIEEKNLLLNETTNFININVEGYVPGIYIVKLFSKDIEYQRKIVKCN